MRVTAVGIGNALGWVGVFLLIAASLALVQRFGPAGMFLLGVLTALICTKAELAEDGGVARYQALLRPRRTPETLAAEAEERSRQVGPLRYYRNCGFFLMALGAVGCLWQIWTAG